MSSKEEIDRGDSGLMKGASTDSDTTAFERISPPCSLHELAPYIGKMRPELARWAIERVTKAGDCVFDPFCGSGTVLLEAALTGRNAVGTDLHPYALLVSTGKISGLEANAIDFESKLKKLDKLIPSIANSIRPDEVPDWVKSFYHPETLRELLAWVQLLKSRKDSYLLACLLAIAHHQRPGFLSFPASHTVPYLRKGKFPQADFPELYEQRSVLPRLLKKAIRSSRRIPLNLPNVSISAKLENATSWRPAKKVDAIVTSPPYMGQLHYARDNRLRLWLMGVTDWENLDNQVSPYAAAFKEAMVTAFDSWSRCLKPDGVLAVLVGETSNSAKTRLDRLVADIAKRSHGAFELTDTVKSEIPNARRARKGCSGSNAESLLILRKTRLGKKL